MNSYFITGYFILANETGIVSPQSVVQRYKRYATAIQKNPTNPMSSQNSALTTRVDIVVRKLLFKM